MRPRPSRPTGSSRAAGSTSSESWATRSTRSSWAITGPTSSGVVAVGSSAAARAQARVRMVVRSMRWSGREPLVGRYADGPRADLPAFGRGRTPRSDSLPLRGPVAGDWLGCSPGEPARANCHGAPVACPMSGRALSCCVGGRERSGGDRRMSGEICRQPMARLACLRRVVVRRNGQSFPSLPGRSATGTGGTPTPGEDWPPADCHGARGLPDARPRALSHAAPSGGRDHSRGDRPMRSRLSPGVSSIAISREPGRARATQEVVYPLAAGHCNPFGRTRKTPREVS